uniref:Somatostatin-2 n=1 Tax=Hucho hucho TaxID=62062 RepID=A0A4W5L1S9_9TELE
RKGSLSSLFGPLKQHVVSRLSPLKTPSLESNSEVIILRGLSDRLCGEIEPELPAASYEDWSKRVMEDILSELSLPEVEAQKSEGSTAEAKEDLERSVDNPNNLPPRERKAGCKNFYWKGFTSC